LRKTSIGIQKEMSGTAFDFNYKLFFDLSPDLLCIAGYDGYFKNINPAVSRTLGYSEEELYARPINDFVYHEDQDITSRVRTELTKAKPLFNFENRYQTKNGEVVWLSWTSLPVESDKLIFAIAKNITHKKRQEAERNTLLVNLTQINTNLKQLTYSTSHDLRAPVNNLLALFGLMDKTRISDNETIEFLEFLQLSGEKLKQTLNNYVDLLNEKQSVHAKVEEVDIDESLQEVIESISSLINTSRTTIHHNVSKGDRIKFNKAYLKSIFLNLLTNSIKYARPDSAPVISIHTSKIKGFSQLIVEDNGLGFDMEKVKGHIFSMHQNFHDHIDSKGIGLYLVHSHVTSLGGKINVESKVNEGTRFIIHFKD
jgi:PAS domain S-box-containing protein